MRIVFMGTPQFAAIILDQLAKAHEVVGVFTQPDAIRSRGKKLEPSPVKLTALEHDIPVFEYATFAGNDAYAALKRLEPEVICVAAYGVLLPQEVIDLPPYGCLNVHGSLLPRWRGAAPIERAILAGDAEIGVCVMKMELGLDTGAYCNMRSIPNEGRSAPELTCLLAEMGARALLDTLDSLQAGTLEWIDQDETQVTYAQKIEKGELDVSPQMKAEEALRKIWASSDNHPAKCMIGGRGVTLVQAAFPAQDAFGEDDLLAGQVAFRAKKLYLGFADGALELLEVHPSGKKRMLAKDFAAGLQGIKRGEVAWGAHGE